MRKSATKLLTETPGSTSFEPYLVFIWFSKIGSVTLIEMAAMIDVRMSEGS